MSELFWQKLGVRSLQRRIQITIIGSVCLVLLSSSIIGYRSIVTQIENKTESYLRLILNQHSMQRDQEYKFLLQATEQLLPYGSVGTDLEAYYSVPSSSRYERLMAAKTISSKINLIRFSNEKCRLITLINVNKKAEEFGTFLLKDSGVDSLISMTETHSTSMKKQPKRIFPVLENLDIHYNAPHQSLMRSSQEEVISILRTTFFRDQPYLIYIELKTDDPLVYREIIPDNDFPFLMAQLDNSLHVVYSNLDELKVMEETGNNFQDPSGQYLGYQWYRQVSPMGYTNIIFMDRGMILYELYVWRNRMFLLVIVSFVILVFILQKASDWVNIPLRLIEEEMHLVDIGDLAPHDLALNIEEFDHLSNLLNGMKIYINQLLANYEAADQERQQLQLNNLYYQINPHFLMNALNSVHWMAAIHGADNITVYISHLIHILGYSLNKVSRDTTLETEIKYLGIYVEMMQMRYDFEYIKDVEVGDYLSLPSARLIMQPIVENALLHGLDNGGLLKLEVSLVNDSSIRIRIINDGDLISKETLVEIQDYLDGKGNGERLGLGIKFVNSNIKEFYGRQAHVKVISSVDQGTIFILDLPLDKLGGKI